jgi:hypothetical protein
VLGGVPTAFRPLRHRDFRLLWTGLAISLVGSGLWLVALAWRVIDELGGGPRPDQRRYGAPSGRTHHERTYEKDEDNRC